MGKKHRYTKDPNHVLAKTYGIPCCLHLLILSVITLVCVQATTDPTSYTCSTHNNTVIELSWTPATDTGVAGYYLYLRRSDGLKTQEGPGINLASRSYAAYTFYGLGFYAQYDISISSYSSTGTNYTVYTATCTTQAGVPDLSNFNLTCEGISSTEITCTWGSLDTVYWNGAPYGWQLSHISYFNDVYTFINVNSTSTLTYTITGLQFDTKYLINIRSVNTDGFMGPYSSTNSKTLGWPSNAENETRYYCYEAIPGYLEISWKEMPCTIYSGAIAGLLLISLLLLITCCCMCCCKGGNQKGGNTEINIINEENNEYYGGGDDDDDDYDETEEEEDEEDEEEEKDEEDDDEEKEEISDGDESPTKAPPLAKKKKLSDDEEGESDDVDESTDEEDSEKLKEEERKKKIKERLKKRNALMGGAAIVKHVDETKKPTKPETKEAPKKKKDSSDEESEGYYEDWNPDADENPDVAVNRKSMKDVDDSSKDEKKDENKEKERKSYKKNKTTKNKNNKKDKNNSNKNDESYDEDDDESTDNDYDDDDSSEEDIGSKSQNKLTKKSENKDSGRDSASSGLSAWGEDTKDGNTNKKSDKSTKEINEGSKKKGGFLSNLFGSTKKSNQESHPKPENNAPNDSSKHHSNNADQDDWGNATMTNTGSGTDNRFGVQTRIAVDQTGKQIVLNAPTIVHSIPLHNGSEYSNSKYDSRPPPGYGRNDNGTFYPLPGNYNPNIPPGFVRNADGSIARTPNNYHVETLHDSNAAPGHAGNSYQSGNRSDNMPPPGYAKNFDGSFYPVRGNTRPVVPPGYIRNPDGTIYKNKSQSQQASSNTAPPGFGKNPDGTFYPMPGNSTPTIPAGFSRNPDGSIYRTTGPSSYQHQQSATHAPQGYVKNSDGSFAPLPSNRNPVIPSGYLRNPDGSIYKNDDQLNSQYANNPYNRNAIPPPGYAPNPDGSFRPLPGNRNTFAPVGFSKNPDGTIRKNDTNQDVPPGYTKNPDGTFRPLHGNTNLAVPAGFTKNPDGTIRRNRKDTNYSNNTVPPGYGKNPDGTFFPLKNNPNPVVPPGFVKNPDGSISKLPHARNIPGTSTSYPASGNHANPNAFQNSTRPYPYGPENLDPPDIPDERDKFNALFVAKAKKKAALKKSGASARGSRAYHNKPNFNGDGEDIFAATNVVQSPADGDHSGTSSNDNLHGLDRNADASYPGGNNYPGGKKYPSVNGLPSHNEKGGNGNQGGSGGNTGDEAESFNRTPNTFRANDPSNNTSNQRGGAYIDPKHADGLKNDPKNKVGLNNGPNYQLDPDYDRKHGSGPFNDPKTKQGLSNHPEYQVGPHNDPKRVVGPNNDPNHGDAFDTEVLPDDRPRTRNRPIRFRNPKQTPAWNPKQPNNPATDKGGKRTPVTELLPPRQERQDLIEPDPVIGSDRLGGKFPFLNVKKKPENDPTANTNTDDSNGTMKRNKSDSDLVMRGREMVNKKDLPNREFPPMPNTLSGKDAAIAASSNDLAGLKPETRDQIFYGFGVGRWRKHAATWLNKWKMKKRPVKTAKASWD